uniref:COMM domain-containing protein n=1 Tax=Glossina brevipalpis TaxID=37001 RepID=A0A1A9X5T3_9MUSC
MKDCEFLLKIDNKEILIEILNHAIDFLIGNGNRNEQKTMHLCYKYGFHSPDDFMLTIRALAKFFKNICCDVGLDINSEFPNLTPELQKLIETILNIRRPEITLYLIRQLNAQNYPLMESFDWDTRLVMGDSNYAHNRRLLTTLTLRLLISGDRKDMHRLLHFQMDKTKLSDFIEAIDSALKHAGA